MNKSFGDPSPPLTRKHPDWRIIAHLGTFSLSGALVLSSRPFPSQRMIDRLMSLSARLRLLNVTSGKVCRFGNVLDIGAWICPKQADGMAPL